VVVANNEAPVVQPGVASVIRRVVLLGLSPVDLLVNHFQVWPVKLVVPVEVVTGHDDNAWVDGTEGNLVDSAMSWRNEVDLTEDAHLVPVPDDDASFGLVAHSDQLPFVFSAEVS